MRLKEAAGAVVYDNNFERLPKRNVSIGTYLASFKYFQLFEEQLRVDLTFKPNILAEAHQWLSEQTPRQWSAKKFVRVVIHVRRRDYNTPRVVKGGWTRPTIGYFQRSISYFSDCLERVQFVVLSDDLGWCKKHIRATNIVYSVRHSPIIDMAIASLCDHAIITVGTYGWWAAWFANGITIRQSNIANVHGLNPDDLYTPDWIAL